MQLYPHWLDGEFVRIASKETNLNQVNKETIRALKLHALLGTQFILNDVQVFDSSPILELFDKTDFQDFVFKDRSFLDLRVKPDRELGTTPFALAARGLARTQAPGWVSSLYMDDPTPIKEFATEILNDIKLRGYIEKDKETNTERKYPKYHKQFNAARHVIFYFGMHDSPEILAASPGKASNYYDVLKKEEDELKSNVNDIKGLPNELRQELLPLFLKDLKVIEETVRFIEGYIKDPDKIKARSQVLAILDKEICPIRREQIWNNVVQAWNYATERTLQPDGGSVGMLSGAVSPTDLLALPMDSLVPIDFTRLSKSITGISHIPTLPLDLDSLSWNEIASAREGAAETMQELARCRQEHFGNVEAISESLRAHINKIAKILKSPNQLSPVPYVLILAITAGPCIAAAIFGDARAIEVATVSATISFPLSSTQQIYRDSEIWRQRCALTNSLFRASIGEGHD